MIAGIMGRKEQLLEANFGSMRSSKEVTATSRRHHVATSPSHDVGSTNCRSQQFSHVATSPRRHVATSPRRHVSSKICISSINARGLGNKGMGERVARDTKIESRATQPSRNFLGFCITFQLFWLFLDHMMMFFILYILFLSFMMF